MLVNTEILFNSVAPILNYFLYLDLNASVMIFSGTTKKEEGKGWKNIFKKPKRNNRPGPFRNGHSRAAV